jgi:sulfite reductase beta subunit-like hemoprotein
MIRYIFLIIVLFLSSNLVKANYLSPSDTHVVNQSNIENDTAAITITVGGAVLLVKSAAGAKVLTVGLGYAKKVLGTAAAIKTVYDLHSYFQNRGKKRQIERLYQMSDDELYDYCHSLGGGMASTIDARENQWGDSYIFGIVKPSDNNYYQGAVCVSG